jgi:NADH-quinone oxidoreductase subunit K
MMCLEMLHLSCTLNFILFSSTTFQFNGQIIGLFLLTIAATESAVGLGLLISAFRLKKGINLEVFNYLHA